MRLLLVEERLRALEDALQRYYEAYERRLKSVEERLRRDYHPIWEREHAIVSGVLRLIAKAMRVAREAREALEQGEKVARVRLAAIAEEARSLRDEALYGSLRVPADIKARLVTLYMLIERVLGSWEAG